MSLVFPEIAKSRQNHVLFQVVVILGDKVSNHSTVYGWNFCDLNFQFQKDKLLSIKTK